MIEGYALLFVIILVAMFNIILLAALCLTHLCQVGWWLNRKFAATVCQQCGVALGHPNFMPRLELKWEKWIF